MDDLEKTLEAIWVRDSETGEEVLIDRIKNKPIAKRINGEIVEL